MHNTLDNFTILQTNTQYINDEWVDSLNIIKVFYPFISTLPKSDYIISIRCYYAVVDGINEFELINVGGYEYIHRGSGIIIDFTDIMMKYWHMDYIPCSFFVRID